MDKEIEELSFKSIKAIHKHLDDDQDGAVNLQESNEVCFGILLIIDKILSPVLPKTYFLFFFFI